jgi:hypothetical protein
LLFVLFFVFFVCGVCFCGWVVWVVLGFVLEGVVGLLGGLVFYEGFEACLVHGGFE